MIQALRRLRPFWIWLAVLALMAAASAPAGALEDPDLTVTGLDDNQYLSGIVNFTIDVGPEATMVFGFSNLLPSRDGTSYLIGQWVVRNTRSIKVQFDTAYLPDGVHAVTFYTRDRGNRTQVMRSFSVVVENFRQVDDPASHIEIERPLHLDKLKGNQLEVTVREFETDQVDTIQYRLSALGGPWTPDLILNDGKIPMVGRRPGWYAVTAWAYDESGQAIDRSTITVYFDAPAQ